MTDTFGNGLRNYLNGDLTPFTIRRDDGFVDKHDVGVYFADYSEWQDFEKETLKHAQGRVLDIGAGAGRHTLYLQKKGFEVHAIDISPGAIEVMKQRGVKNVHLMDFRKLDFPENYFDSILIVFNYSALAYATEGTKEFLKTLYRLSTPKGRIITTIRDPYQTDIPEHLAYQERNKKAGKLAGQIKIRIEYKDEIGDWFELLMISSQELEALITETGWRILKIVEGKGENYGAVLEKIKFS